MKLVSLIALLLLLPTTLIAAESKGTITVKVENLHSDIGTVRAVMFLTEEGFPTKEELSFKGVTVNIVNKSAEVTFADIPYGQYAIAVNHDENANGEMDLNFLKIPKEGQGASNNPKPSLLGPPKFQDAKFVLSSETMHLTIEMKY